MSNSAANISSRENELRKKIDEKLESIQNQKPGLFAPPNKLIAKMNYLTQEGKYALEDANQPGLDEKTKTMYYNDALIYFKTAEKLLTPTSPDKLFVFQSLAMLYKQQNTPASGKLATEYENKVIQVRNRANFNL